MLNFLYTIFIYPVYLLVELIFFIANTITNESTGFSIIVLSFIVNIICLPIYNIAEKYQEDERLIQKKLKKKIKDIKAVFKGDERYMILSTYYRQNNYHPLYVLRSVFPLFIQIPFFMAAYSFLSNLSLLKNSSFMFLNDLSKPDYLLNLGGLSINVLPIVMTVINLIASGVYTKGLEIKDKLQLYITAFIFLILLYNSSAGLVFYWTLNNLFSLFKNIFYRIKLSKKVWYLLSLSSAVVLDSALVITHAGKKTLFIMGFVTIILLLLPLVKKITDALYRVSTPLDKDRNRFLVFFFAVSAFIIFISLVLPTATIASSPDEFSNIDGIINPLTILYFTVTQGLGILFWLVCLYFLFEKTAQKFFVYFSLVFLLSALVNAYIFTGNYGNIGSNLMFDDIARLYHPFRYFLLNIFILCIVLMAVFLILYIKKISKFLRLSLGIIIISFLSIAFISCISIGSNFHAVNTPLYSKTKNKAYKVTKTGQNIFILMLDRSMNFFIDSIFENCESVRKEYTGFTLFENTIAFGRSTNSSCPSLFGGYEYTPENINNRSSELLIDKHNEALSVLPRLFSENNWNVSFTDPPWLNYSWIPDLSVFSKYDMTAKNIDFIGKYTDKFLLTITEMQSIKKSSPFSGIKRNMLLFSFFRVLPVEVRRAFYAKGKYAGLYHYPNLPYGFFDAYSAIQNLNEEVEFVTDKNCINIIVNNTPHEPPKEDVMRFIKRDELIPIAKSFCLNEYTAEHFYANYLAHEECAKFFRFLKENDCWENSRIIIAGDHGRATIHTKDMKFIEEFSGKDISPESLIPLFMMKDFNSEGELKEDYTFMTLADIPILTTEGLPSELQKNPFTGVPFKNTQNKKVVKVMSGGDWAADTQKKYTQFKTTDTDWVYIKDNVYDPNNWSRTNFNKE